MSRFFAQLQILKSVLSSPSTIEEKFAQVQPMLSDEDVQREFWNMLLEDPAWLPVLKKAGIFDNPPPVITDSAGGTRFPYWGASKYLARVAGHRPAEVARIFADMTTENVSVIGDMLDAARALPIQDASTIVPIVRQAAENGSLWVHFKDASDLCVRLSQEGAGDSALKLADALFSPKSQGVQRASSSTDAYWYRKGLAKVAPELAKNSARQFLPMITSWVETLVRSSKTTDSTTDNDLSYIWRPAIEEHEQNHGHDPLNVLIGCLRQAFEIGIRAGDMLLSEELDLLEGRKLLVLRRLGVHLLAELGDRDLARVKSAVLDRNLFEDFRFKHEYSRLAERQLLTLEEADRDKWYAWIDEGPDMGDFDDNVRAHLHREPTIDDRSARIDYWKFEKLHWVRNIIDGPRRAFYTRMLAELGTPELADLNIRTRTGWVAETAVFSEKLSEMAFEEAVDWVSTWQPPSEGIPRPTITGLSEKFGEYVTTRPEEFSKKARVLTGRPAPFVGAFLRQMRAAIQTGREIAVESVLDLCQWIVSQRVDEGWQLVREDISELIQTVCEARSENRPRFEMSHFRHVLWTLIRALYRDASESHLIRDTEVEDVRVHDYLDLGLNSPRGRAVQAGLEFARWVALHLTEGSTNQNGVPGGVESIPELLELLEWQMAPGNRSLEAMAIIGSRLGVINWVDAQWLTNNAHRLFNLEEVEKTPAHALGWAAWNAFLSWVNPHIAFYRALRGQFDYAVRQSALVRVDSASRPQPMHHLGEHLILLYGRGQLSLTDNVLRQFLRDANPAIRRHAIGFVGSSVSQQPIESQVQKRLMALWDSYWTDRGRNDASQDPSAIVFGAWFASGKFPDEWALASLYEFVEVVGVPEPAHEVLERLAAIGQVNILQAVTILDRMVRGNTEKWSIQTWQDSIKSVLQKAVKSASAAQATAVELIDYLGRQGYTSFGSLLNLAPGPGSSN